MVTTCPHIILYHVTRIIIMPYYVQLINIITLTMVYNDIVSCHHYCYTCTHILSISHGAASGVRRASRHIVKIINHLRQPRSRPSLSRCTKRGRSYHNKLYIINNINIHISITIIMIMITMFMFINNTSSSMVIIINNNSSCSSSQ